MRVCIRLSMKTADAGDVFTSVETDNFTHEEAQANVKQVSVYEACIQMKYNLANVTSSFPPLSLCLSFAPIFSSHSIIYFSVACVSIAHFYFYKIVR